MRRAPWLLLWLLQTACPSSGGADPMQDPPFDAGLLDAGFYDGGRPTDPQDGGPDGGSDDAGPGPDAGERDAGPRDAGPPANPCNFVRGDDVAQYAAVLACLADPDAPEGDKRGFVQDFVAAVETQGGFPIATDDGFIFVYVRTAALDVEDDANAAEDFTASRRRTPISVTGDFDMWTPGTHVLTDHDYDFFSAEVPVDPVLFERARYKFVAQDDNGTDVWFSDPLSRRFDFDENGRISIVRGGPAQGHLEWIRDVEATMLGNVRPIYLYVPPGYDTTAGERYAVLYMHDGNNLFDAQQPRAAPVSWEVDAVLEAEIAANTSRAGIVVGIPNNANRIGEYTHIADDFGDGLLGGDGDLYAHFVAEQLKPLVDTRYRTFTDRANTGVFGSSLGGLVSFHIGLQYPGVFRFVGGMSSTFNWGRFGAMGPNMVEVYEADTNLGTRNQIFYLDSGGGAGTGCSAGSGSDNYCETLEMRAALVAAGISTFPDDPDAVPLTPADLDVFHYWEPDAPHAEASWNARLHRPLRMFFRR